ncbi:hypothetical protein P2A10_22200, partial [Xanthomonas perforans]
PNFERDEVVDEPMEAPFYPATSCFHKRNRILRVIFIRMSAEPQDAPDDAEHFDCAEDWLMS